MPRKTGSKDEKQRKLRTDRQRRGPYGGYHGKWDSPTDLSLYTGYLNRLGPYIRGYTKPNFDPVAGYGYRVANSNPCVTGPTFHSECLRGY